MPRCLLLPWPTRSSAILYDLVKSAKLHSLPVYDYFSRYILRKFPYCESQEDYEALPPFNVTPVAIRP